jgi:hypothetical protein
MVNYDYGPGSYNITQLQGEITAAGLAAPAGINGTGYAGPGTLATNISVLYAAALSAADQTTLNNTVAAHVAGAAPPPSAGGLLAVSNVTAFESTTGTGWTALPTAEIIKFTLPAAGNVLLRFCCETYNSTAGAANSSGFLVDGAVNAQVSNVTVPAANYVGPQVHELRLAGLAGGAHTVQAVYHVNAGSGTWQQRVLSAWSSP